MHYERIDSHLKTWEQVFSTRAWGRYPPEELVRFLGRRYGAHPDRDTVRVLDIGCGPGANLWYLAREGYDFAAIDGSPTAIRRAGERLVREGLAASADGLDLRVGNFAQLPWPDARFDVAIDIESISMNCADVVRDALAEAHRVLKPGGVYFAKMFGRETTGYDPAREIEPGTMRDPADGPCAGFGHVHFFGEAELRDRFAAFARLDLEWVLRRDRGGDWTVQEWLVTATK